MLTASLGSDDSIEDNRLFADRYRTRPAPQSTAASGEGDAVGRYGRCCRLERQELFSQRVRCHSGHLLLTARGDYHSLPATELDGLSGAEPLTLIVDGIESGPPLGGNRSVSENGLITECGVTACRLIQRGGSWRG